MADTRIEWADRSWNPISGCTKISEACQNCYAERMSKRLAGRCGYPKDKPFSVTLHRDKLDEPLRWKKPSRIFVCSMGDLFHEDVPEIEILQIFSIMAECPQHTFLVLTKRPERMKEVLTSPTVADDVWLCTTRGVTAEPSPWPLPNVWLGVTAENQQRADERIPVLLQIPAAKRFVSIEPMLGPIDLTRWIIPRTPFTPENAPDTWLDFTWPDWVPEKVREQIECFWGQFGRKPRDWAENAIHNDSPPFGMHMGYRDERNGEAVYGRWIFAWNNIGRLIGDNGEIYYPSIPRAHLFDTTRYYWHDLHWTICGGETGPGARPMHPNWARSLRDQCQAAGTPYFFKSWGDWQDGSALNTNAKHLIVLNNDETVEPGQEPNVTQHQNWQYLRPCMMSRVGKKNTGRLLDGVEWNQYPEVTP